MEDQNGCNQSYLPKKKTRGDGEGKGDIWVRNRTLEKRERRKGVKRGGVG